MNENCMDLSTCNGVTFLVTRAETFPAPDTYSPFFFSPVRGNVQELFSAEYSLGIELCGLILSTTVWLTVNPLPHKSLFLPDCSTGPLQTDRPGQNLGKEEIACYEQFILFPHSSFFTLLKNFLPFLSTLIP